MAQHGEALPLEVVVPVHEHVGIDLLVEHLDLLPLFSELKLESAPGNMRDLILDGTHTLIPVAALDIQHRRYFTPKSYVRFSGKTFLSKDSF